MKRYFMRHDKKAGYTGRPGDPRLAPNDNNALRIAVKANRKADMVILDFGEEPVSFVAIPRDKIMALVKALAEAAASLETDP
jgi:hypothetical protein